RVSNFGHDKNDNGLQAGDRSKDKNLSLINGDNERTIVDHAPFVGSIVPVAVRFFQANIEEG
ncbi:hypothetical protein WDU90_11110, partial [Klebsiella pneumoniae]